MSNPEISPLPPLSQQVSSSHYCHLEVRDSRRELAVICAGMEQCDPDYVTDRTGFPCLVLEFVAEGTGGLILDGRHHPLHAGVAFVYGEGTPHRIVNDSNHPMTKYFVNFTGAEARELLDRSGLAPGCATQAIELAAIRLLLDQMIADGAAGSEAAPALCELYLRAILLKLAAGVLPQAPDVAHQLRQFHQWREFIDRHFLEFRDLNELSRALRVRPAQLCRVFQKYGHASPFRYLTRRKMNHAAGLLVSGKTRVREAADVVGYPDPYHFSRLFKKHFGHSPAHFRRLFGRDAVSQRPQASGSDKPPPAHGRDPVAGT